MRKRIQCGNMLRFGKTENPCHKILLEVEAKDVIEENGSITVIGLEKLKIKCRCGGITEIINQVRRKKS